MIEQPVLASLTYIIDRTIKANTIPMTTMLGSELRSTYTLPIPQVDAGMEDTMEAICKKELRYDQLSKKIEENVDPFEERWYLYARAQTSETGSPSRAHYEQAQYRYRRTNPSWIHPYRKAWMRVGPRYYSEELQTRSLDADAARNTLGYVNER